MEIIEVDYGIANNFGTYIEINKNLKNYPQLREQILKHEEAHNNGKGTSMEDFTLDFLMPHALHYKEMFKFMIKHPKSFTHLFPIYYTRKHGWIYDINMMVMYLIMLGIFTTTIYVGGKIL